jgi:hypothetical protein
LIPLTIVALIAASDIPSHTPLQALALQAVASDPAVATAATAALRAAGPAGLQALLAVHGTLIDAQSGRQPGMAHDERWPRLRAALDAVCAQKDAHASRLYWHTDLDEARTAARAEGKPILSLRLFGRLTDEFSCANSRYFRSVLYANTDVSRILRDRFVLHWQSVRPVPLVTVDFGDGRRLQRTLTGNSVHHVLDCDGRLVDSIPGLYGPAAFIRALIRAEQVALDLSAGARGQDELRRHHAQRLAATEASWQVELLRLGVLSVPRTVLDVTATGAAGPVAAPLAAKVAISKRAVEMPLLSAVVPATAGSGLGSAGQTVTGFTASADDATWARLAESHRDDARLDEPSKRFMRCMLDADAACAVPGAPRQDFETVLESFERSLAEDTVRNEYDLHRRIHAWFTEPGDPQDVEAFTERIYSELFLTPLSDPWLGLAPADVYTGLHGV